LRTTDTNTRIRKKSVDIIYQVWDFKVIQPKAKEVFGKEAGIPSNSQDSVSTMMANIITNTNLGEKSIIGRLGLLIKRA